MSRFIYHPLAIIIITVLGVVFFFSLDKSGKRTEISTENIKSMEEQVHQMSNDVLELEEDIMEVDTDEWKEKTVRNELLLEKENELTIQLPEFESEEKSQSETTQKKEPINQWLELLNL